MFEWLRRWTWNPMGISRAVPNPARSVRSFFSDRYSGEVGNTNQYLYWQATETDEPNILNYFSWKGHVGDSVWKRPPRQASAKKSKISASNKLSEDRIGFHQNKINVNKAMTDQWLRRWTWNPMGTSRHDRALPAAFDLIFRNIFTRMCENSDWRKYNQKKLGTRTNTCVRKQLRDRYSGERTKQLTSQRFSITFPGKDM